MRLEHLLSGGMCTLFIFIDVLVVAYLGSRCSSLLSAALSILRYRGNQGTGLRLFGQLLLYI